MGRELQIGSSRVRVHVDPEHGSGRLFVFESTLAPGGGMPYRHRHDELEESFYVLEGTIEYTLDDETVPARSGTALTAPAGTAHRFVNSGTGVARHLVMITPGLAGLGLVDELSSIDFADLRSVIEAHRRHASQLVDHPD